MKSGLLTRIRIRLSSRRGQSMVAYALVSFSLLAGSLMLIQRIIPDLLNGMDQFAKSMYLGINLPFP
jgi:hypothetical protein